jgi:hypothetical protein
MRNYIQYSAVPPQPSRLRKWKNTHKGRDKDKGKHRTQNQARLVSSPGWLANNGLC